MPRGGPRLRATNGKKNLVGERVEERRKEMQLTQAMLTARLAYVTEGNWNPTLQEVLHIEQGTRLVSDVEVVSLAEALGVKACWLLTGVME